MNRKFSLAATLLLLLLFHSGFTQNQELKFTLVTNPNGKSLGKINAISQDPHGYIWLAGQSEKCIYRYDGNRIINFRHDNANPNSLAIGNIETLYTDDSGMVWIGAVGVDKYDPSTGIFTFFEHQPNDTNSLSSNVVNSILRDRKGRLWVGTDMGLDRLDEKSGKFIHYRKQPGNNRSLSSNVVWRLYEDRQGVIWVATGMPWFNIDPEDGGLNRLENDGSFTRFLHVPNDPNSLINNKIAAVFEDSRGTLWVGTSGDGLHTMDRKTGKFQRLQYNPDNPGVLSRPPIKKGDLAVNDKITFITEDSTGCIWIGTRSSGINRYNPGTKKLTHFEHSNGFPDSTSWYISVSREGVVWIATEDANLYRCDPFDKPISSIQIGTTPMSFLEDMDGFLWVGTLGQGLYKFNQQNQIIQQFKYDPSRTDGINGINVPGLFQINKESIWVGATGLRVLNTVTNQISPADIVAINDSVKKDISFIYLDKQGIYWFGRWGGGLTRYDPKDHSYEIFRHDELDSTTINSDQVSYIHEDKMGLLWIATSKGINLLNREKGQFKRYLRGNWTSSFYEDSEGNLWTGSDYGFFQYNRKDDKFLLFFDEKSEMNTFTTGGITEDESKNLWLLNQKGIVKLNPSTREMFIYSNKYGIVPNELTTWSKIYKNRKGQIFMPHGSGYYTFSPKELINNRKLNILITEVFVNSLQVLAGKQSVLKDPIEETNELELKYDQNNLAFNFTAIDFREPELTRYYTMLEKYNNSWREVVGEKTSYYNNIQPGKYQLHIKAYTPDGLSAEKILTIQILPPWWRTWWAYAFYIALIISALLVADQAQKKRIIQKERQKAQVVELAQAKEIAKAYDELRSTQAQLIQSEKMASLGELTAGIAHEIQNPLNFVNNFSDINQELINELKDEVEKGNMGEVKEIAENLKDNEAKINFHGKRADSIVKGMLQHSRTSTGQKEPTDINALADEYLRLAYHGLRAKDKMFNAILKTDFDPQIKSIDIIQQDIGRVLLNLYNNAFYAVSEKKKTSATTYEPAVSVTTSKQGGKIKVVVSDNGMGISEQLKDKIFQPFFTTKPTGQGTGLGLSLSYDIIKAHGGTLKVESRENEFTRIFIELPV
jgi:ligand-binding sensor domain-containing protein/signal transduction histidine kinase